MRRKWYNKRSKVDKSKGGEVDNGQEPVSSKRSSFDFAANKLFWGPSINDPSSDAAASSNELPNQPPPENHQTQDAGAEGLDPVQQEAYQKEMAKEKAKGIRRQRRIEQQVRFFDYCLEQCNNLIEEVSTEERRQIYERRLEEIRVTFPELFNDNRLQTTSATKYSLIFKSRLGRDQRDQVEINIRKVVRQLYKLTGEVIIQEGLEFKKLRASVKKLHTDAHELIQHIHESHTLWMQAQSCSDLTPENYNPYYSMKDVKDKERINIDSTLPGSVGIRAIRRVLSRLDIDIYKDATEQEVAKLAGHSEHEGTSTSKMQEAFQHFGIEYSYINKILTIVDIEKVTKCDGPVLAHVDKQGIGGSFVVIEKVSRNENGEPICTIYDPYDPNNQKIREISYSKLQLVLSDQYLLPTKWRELTNNLSESAPETAVIQQHNESIGISEPSSESVQDIKKKADEHQAIIAESKNLLAKHPTLLQKSKQDLADYEQLRSDSQRYERAQQESKENRDLLLKKLHEAQRGTTLDTNEIENQIPSITDLQKLEEAVAQHEINYQTTLQESTQALTDYQQLLKDPQTQRYKQKQQEIKAESDLLLEEFDYIKRGIDKLSKEEQEIIINDELWQKYVSKHKEKDYTNQEEIRLLYKYVKDRLWKLHTPEDKIFIQQEKLFSLYTDSKELHKKIAKVLNEDTPFTIKMQLQQILTPEDKIYRQKEIFEALCRKLKEIYQKMTASSQTIPEGLEYSNLSTATPDEPDESAHATEIEQLCERIQQAIEESEEPVTTFNDFLKSRNYNPFYSMDGVKYVKTVNIDSKRRNSCAISATRRALFLQGIDIEKDATEQEVAELVSHSEEAGTLARGYQKAYKRFGIDVSCIHEALTIDDIERITGCGHPITIGVRKEGLPIGHDLLIEKVSRTENGVPVCTVFDPYDQNNPKIWEIPYRNLEEVSNNEYIVPTNYRELTQCVPGSDEMKLRSRQMSWRRSLSHMRQLEKKVAECQDLYPDILKQSEQTLSEYQRDPHKRVQEQAAVKTQGTRLLEQLHDIERRIRDLPEEEQKIILDDELWKKYVSKYKNKGKDYTQQKEILSSYKRIKDQLSKLYTPEYKLYMQLEKLFSLDKAIHDIHQESNSIHQNIVTEEQENSKLSNATHQELIKSSNAIKTDIEHFYGTIQVSHEKIRFNFTQDLLKKFKDQMPENYNPFYSMKDVKNEESINIDSTLPRSVGIRAIRRVLSLLGVDIYKDATEQKIARLADHSEYKGTLLSEMQEAFKPFNINYSYTNKILTIDEIAKVTEHDGPILTHIYKEGIAGSFVVIEKVNWENGEPICTIYDPRDPNDQKIREIPYSELQLVLSDHHLLPTNWQELPDTHEV